VVASVVVSVAAVAVTAGAGAGEVVVAGAAAAGAGAAVAVLFTREALLVKWARRPRSVMIKCTSSLPFSPRGPTTRSRSVPDVVVPPALLKARELPACCLTAFYRLALNFLQPCATFNFASLWRCLVAVCFVGL